MAKLIERLAQGFFLACLAAVAASLLVAVIQHIYVPISPDGGWYTYPAYAWAVGGDPSENVPGADISAASERLTTTFVWENRSNLIVPLTGLWFRLVPASYWSLSYFGFLQWVLLASLAGAVVWIATRDRMMSLAAAVITLSDSRLINEVISDARPDVPVALTAMALLAALAAMLQKRTPINTMMVLALAAALPLVHVTSANSIALLMGFIGLWIIGHWRDEADRTTLVWAGLAAVMMAALFLLRQPLMDVLVPTTVPVEIEKAGQHSLLDKLKENFNFGLVLKLKMEWERWSTQFNPLNLAQLAFVLAGATLGLKAFLRGGASFATRFGLAVLAALGASAIFMFAVNPHHTPGHALVLAVLGYAGAAVALNGARESFSAGAVQLAAYCTGLLLLAAALKLVHSGYTYLSYARHGISNVAIESALDETVPKDGAVKLLGASELWPYLARRRQRIHIIDPNRMFIPKGPASGSYRGVRLLLVNEDHMSWGWAEAIERWQSEGLITPVRSVGTCGITKRCLAIYAFKANATNQ